MFIIGTGIVFALNPPRYWYKGISRAAAAAFATAIETPRIAFAPSLALFGVPSSSIMALSTATWSRAFIPIISSPITEFTFSTAVSTPFPLYLSPPSLSSTASKAPVDAPEGTAARPV